jgi:hypothetical protein
VRKDLGNPVAKGHWVVRSSLVGLSRTTFGLRYELLVARTDLIDLFPPPASWLFVFFLYFFLPPPGELCGQCWDQLGGGHSGDAFWRDLGGNGPDSWAPIGLALGGTAGFPVSSPISLPPLLPPALSILGDLAVRSAFGLHRSAAAGGERRARGGEWRFLHTRTTQSPQPAAFNFEPRSYV